MLSLLFMAKKKKKSLEETVHMIQQGDQELQNELIDSYKPFIAKSVSSVCKRFISEADDEFSIGLIAFNEAIQKYNESKGKSLLTFADVLIKRRVIDYIRAQAKHKNLSLQLNDAEEEENSQSTVEAQISMDAYQVKTETELRKDEILRFSKELLEFDLSFDELIKNSPKHADARRNAILVAKALAYEEELKTFLIEKRKLPMKQLEEKVHVSRKTIERNRKYIIAMALILDGEYTYLSDYIKGVVDT